MTREEFIKFCKDNSLTYEEDPDMDIFAYLLGEKTFHRELVFAVYRNLSVCAGFKPKVETFTNVHFDEDDNAIRLDSEFMSETNLIDTVEELMDVYKDMVKKYNDFRKQLRIKKIEEL